MVMRPTICRIFPTYAGAQGGRDGEGRGDEPEVGAADAAVTDEGADDAAGGGVDGDRQAEADAGDGGVDADDAAAGVGEGAAGVAGVEGGVGLDDVLDDADGTAAAGGQGPAEGGHDTGGDRSGEAEGIADGDDELPDDKAVAVAEGDGTGGVAVGKDDGQVGQRVGADDGERGGGAVGEGGLPGARAADHVGVGEQEPVTGEGHRGSGALAAPVPHAQRGHPGRQLAGDGGHRGGVGVQRRFGAPRCGLVGAGVLVAGLGGSGVMGDHHTSR